MYEKAIGIDLGTTNSCVAVVENGKPVVIANRGGYRTTPSVVAIAENGRRLVGHIAKRQSVTNAENTAHSVKRLIGRSWSSPAVQAVKELGPYRLVEGPHQDIRVQLREHTFSIPEISAFVLQEMKLVAERHLGQTVNKAVITVPAYFNDNQRQATKDAGRIAGLEVMRVINEPTAAALTYGFGRRVDGCIAVYDLGGGTFDIAILEVSNGVFEVLGSAGDTFLGGEDFDRRIIDWLVTGFGREHKVNLRRDPMAMQRLKDAAERAKCELSTLPETEINLPFITSIGPNQSLHLQRVLSRQKLEELTADLVERTVDIVRMALDEANLSTAQITEVILVGGMTRMPRVEERVSTFFGREANRGVHPDEVVATGAAIQAAALIEKSTDVLLLDVTPHSLGIMVAGGHFHKLIERNTTVPTSKMHVFTTVRDDQTSVKILVFQGEKDRAQENEMLGEFVLSGLRKARRGEVEVEVTFGISSDGLVSVSACDLETGQAQSITLVASSGLTEAEVDRMAGENRDYLLALKQEESAERARQELEKLVDLSEGLLPRVAELLAGTPFESQSLAAAKAVLGDARAAVTRRDAEAVVRMGEPVERTLRMFRGLVASVAASEAEHDDPAARSSST
ncbi:MAG TPA: molecular chaperone DnaK [Polyangia bacterium]